MAQERISKAGTGTGTLPGQRQWKEREDTGDQKQLDVTTAGMWNFEQICLQRREKNDPEGSRQYSTSQITGLGNSVSLEQLSRRDCAKHLGRCPSEI